MPIEAFAMWDITKFGGIGIGGGAGVLNITFVITHAYGEVINLGIVAIFLTLEALAIATKNLSSKSENGRLLGVTRDTMWLVIHADAIQYIQ